MSEEISIRNKCAGDRAEPRRRITSMRTTQLHEFESDSDKQNGGAASGFAHARKYFAGLRAGGIALRVSTNGIQKPEKSKPL